MATKFVFLNVFTLIETICPKRWAKPFAKERKKVHLRLTLFTESKTSLLELPNNREL